MTYSIIGRDDKTGDLGVLLQSFYYACGPRTILGREGVGIAVMQMVPEMSYGTNGLDMLATGVSPGETLATLVEADPTGAIRQVAYMNTQGHAAAFTGEGCIPASGHRVAENCSAQGAMVESESVWMAAAESFLA